MTTEDQIKPPEPTTDGAELVRFLEKWKAEQDEKSARESVKRERRSRQLQRFWVWSIVSGVFLLGLIVYVPWPVRMMVEVDLQTSVFSGRLAEKATLRTPVVFDGDIVIDGASAVSVRSPNLTCADASSLQISDGSGDLLELVMQRNATITLSRDPSTLVIAVSGPENSNFEPFAVRAMLGAFADGTGLELNDTCEATKQAEVLDPQSLLAAKVAPHEQLQITFFGVSAVDANTLPLQEISFDWPTSSATSQWNSGIHAGTVRLLSTGEEYELKRGYGLYFSGLTTSWMNLGSDDLLNVVATFSTDDVQIAFPGEEASSIRPTIFERFLAFGEAKAAWALLTGYLAVLAAIYARMSNYFGKRPEDK